MVDWTVKVSDGRIYRVWCMNSLKPVEYIQAASSFIARKAYAELYKEPVFNCMSRWDALA